ncbi:MAG TPA: nuclear transport factor 2 family protein [Candidatus Limnocylindria bacterium]|nr:nuclear transport factor 2 family protein [Candidatus Limnocylindria bacterium]
MAGDEQMVTQVFRDYVESFRSLKPDGVVPYCDAPCLFISAQGTRMMKDTGEVTAFIAQLMEGLKARGFTRSELSELKVNQMSAHIAVVSVKRIRYKADGQELERLGETYVLRKNAESWKIVMAMTHDADRVLQLA